MSLFTLLPVIVLIGIIAWYCCRKRWCKPKYPATSPVNETVIVQSSPRNVNSILQSSPEVVNSVVHPVSKTVMLQSSPVNTPIPTLSASTVNAVASWRQPTAVKARSYRPRLQSTARIIDDEDVAEYK